MKVVHLAYQHRYNDIRIFEKECVSLAKDGYDVVYITSSRNSPLMGRQKIKGVEIIVIPAVEKNRYMRVIKYLYRAYKEAVLQVADIYHAHEIWYLPLLPRLMKKGKVIFDSHEDHPRDIFAGRIEGQKWWEKIGEKVFEAYEKTCLKRISGVIVVSSHMVRLLEDVNDNIAVIENYPLLEEFQNLKHDQYNTRIIFYGGAISETNGILNVIKAMEDIDGTLVLAGVISSDFRDKAARLNGWSKVKELGFISREKMKDWYSQCNCGVVLYQLVPNAIGAIPNKMFEYMAASVPIVISNFDWWKSIIEKEQCGICVNPQDSKEIAKAINYILDNSQEAEKMGENGYRCVQDKYSWEGGVLQKFLTLYQKITM